MVHPARERLAAREELEHFPLYTVRLLHLIRRKPTLPYERVTLPLPLIRLSSMQTMETTGRTARVIVNDLKGCIDLGTV